MSIVSEALIKEYSTKPTAMGSLRGKTFYTSWTQEQVDEYNLKTGILETDTSEYANKFRMVIRPLTEKEIQGWYPLITPFVPNEVKTDKENLQDFTNRMIELICNLPEDHPDAGRLPLEICFDGDTIDGKPVALETRNVVPYGLRGHNYIFRLSETCYSFTEDSKPRDPLLFETYEHIVHHINDFIVILPGESIVGYSLESFQTSTYISGNARGVDAYTRMGLNITIEHIPSEAIGQLTILMTNVSKAPIKVYANQGIGIMSFFFSQN